jgi:hypothetical protein
MKPYAFLATVLAIAVFISAVAMIEAPRKPKKEDTIYVLPRVEEIPTNPNPLSI